MREQRLVVRAEASYEQRLVVRAEVSYENRG